MSNQLRKIRRNGVKALISGVKKEMKKTISEKASMFSRMPENCAVCNGEYDKKSKEMAKSWRVFVKKDEIRLYCPQCFAKAEALIKKLKEQDINV